MKQDLGNRQKRYEDSYDYSIINRIPVIIRVDGRGFTKLTRDVPRPFCYKTSGAMAYAMFETIRQIDSSLIGYTQSDEITFVLWPKNIESEPWFNNRIQKIGSIVSSMVTYYFNEYVNSSEEPPNIKGPALFDARVFGLPNATEVINNLIFRQQDCRVNAVSSAAMAELGRKYGRTEAAKRLNGKKSEQRIQMLKDECGIVFEEEYPSNFKWGIAAYKAPKVIKTSHGNISRTKWTLDIAPPDFIKDRMFLVAILSNGADIFRPERDLSES